MTFRTFARLAIGCTGCVVLVIAGQCAQGATNAVEAAAAGRPAIEEITIVGVAPASGTGVASDRLPFNVQAADAEALTRARSLDLSDFLSGHFGSINVNAAQNNPLQPDVQHRGFAASPLLGLAQGIAVYQNGVRVNEPLGDAVNWDLIPESAVHGISLIGGSNPLYGLNTLGGALAVAMKNGFNFEGGEAEVQGGAWGRTVASVESGDNNGRSGYYINASHFDERGWRDLSASDALNVFGALSYRGSGSVLDVSIAHANTDLIGNGAAPRGLLAVDRDAVFTAPDRTEHVLTAVTVNGEHTFSDHVRLNAMSFYRHNDTDSFNGDATEMLACALGEGDFLLEGLEEDELVALGLNADDVCEANLLGVADPEALEDALNAELPVGVDVFDIDEVELSGSGVVEDAAINNQSRRQQKSYGGDWNLSLTHDSALGSHLLIAGIAWFHGGARFAAVTELSGLDPLTRSTRGRGVGSFIDEEATRVRTTTATWSIYAMDVLAVSEALTFTAGGRFNDTEVEVHDRSGRRPELNGKHGFARLNPMVGATYDFSANTNAFVSYSQSSRAPTPIELSCNAGVFDVARAAAIARGDDADDVDFECRLPNAFLADPPLDDVVARTLEAGVRGTVGPVRHRLSYFRTVNRDDILFQTTGRGTGLFANVDRTLRSGFESAFAMTVGRFEGGINYSWIRAIFADDFDALSPNHPDANEDGEVSVRAGDRIPGIPEHQLKLSGDFDLLPSARAGVDVVRNSGQYLRGDESNVLGRLDGYTVVNVRVSYTYGDHLELFARVTNLFDADYESFGLLGEDPTELLPGLADDSPQFLGAGAPRGAWLGVRVRL